MGQPLGGSGSGSKLSDGLGPPCLVACFTPYTSVLPFRTALVTEINSPNAGSHSRYPGGTSLM